MRCLATVLALGLMTACIPPKPVPPDPPATHTLVMLAADSTTAGALSQVLMTIQDGPSAGQSQVTDATGRADFGQLPEAGFTVCGTKAQYADMCVGVTLTSPRVVSVLMAFVGGGNPPGPIDRPAVIWPAIGASYYTSLTDSDLDLDFFATELGDWGVQWTRVWLLDAWALGERRPDGSFLEGQYDGRIPVMRQIDGRFDLDEWNPAYFDHLKLYTDTLNAHGVWPQFTILELYTWSDRKADLPFVPTVELNVFRNNSNGVKWGDPDDLTFFTLPDEWLSAFICKVVTTLDGTSYAMEAANEMPEKGLNFRLAEQAQACGYGSSTTSDTIAVNRQNDSPGQYWNMEVGGPVFSHISYHGKLDISYLDEVYPDEAPAGRPTTFREAWPMYEAFRVILSSDGGGGNPDLQPDLLVVAQDALARGGSYEHQLALKRNRFFGDGTLRMEDMAIDEDFIRTLTGKQ